MSVFSVRIDKLNEAAQKYSRVIAEVDVQRKNYNALIRDIDDSWDGLASQAYIRRMRGEESKLVNLRKYAVALRKYCIETADKMEAIDKMLQHIMGLFSSLWGTGSGGSNTTNGGGGAQIEEPAIVAYDYGAELDAITKAATQSGEEITWNYPDKNGIQAVSCQWFSYAKLCERGFAKDTGAHFSPYKPAESIAPKGTQTFTGAISAIEERIKNNGGEPIYNVLIQGNNSGHTALIDKAYIDGSGKLKLIFSEHADLSQRISVKQNVDGVTITYPFKAQKEYYVSELSQMWNMSNYVKTVSIYGESNR